MIVRLASAGSWAILVVAFVTLGVAATTPLTGPSSLTEARVETPVAPARPQAESLATLIVARDVFRTERRASTAAYSPGIDDAARESDEAAPKPRLRLAGILLGGGARALVDGLPGTTGARLLGVGDQHAGIRVVAIGARSVRLAGLDTTWTLLLERRP